MAEGLMREPAVHRPRPALWPKVFGTFLVALDPFKLLVAALGIVATAVGWWLISVVFYYSWTVPNINTYEKKAEKRSELTTEDQRRDWAQAEYDRDFASWTLIHELAGPTQRSNTKYAEYYQKKFPAGTVRNERLAHGFGGKYRTMPWDENRGPNPFLMTRTVVGGTGPERRETFGQFATYQLPNLVEPLLKFLTPVYYLFDHRANLWTYLYLFCLILWLLVVWALFGGVITRMAVLQLTGKEGGGLREAFAYVRRRYVSYLLSPLVPLLLIGFLVLCCMLFGVIHWVPILGDFWDGLFWFLPLLAGLFITLILVGMIGYPMMYTTLSAEGSDTFDALSRSYNYVYESPWHYLLYTFLAILYGAVLTLFVVVVGSLATYFAKWGVSKFPAWGTDRSPEYLFIYAPESLGWKKLLVEGSPAEINDLGEPTHPGFADYMSSDNFNWWNHAGAGMVSFWITLVFLMVIGFSYSYFWTASTQVYLLMRRRVDETELDEVYVEEEAPEPPPATTTPSPVPTPTAPTSVPVDAPSLRQPETPPIASAPAQSTAPPGDAPPSPS